MFFNHATNFFFQVVHLLHLPLVLVQPELMHSDSNKLIQEALGNNQPRRADLEALEPNLLVQQPILDLEDLVIRVLLLVDLVQPLASLLQTLALVSLQPLLEQLDLVALVQQILPQVDLVNLQQELLVEASLVPLNPQPQLLPSLVTLLALQPVQLALAVLVLGKPILQQVLERARQEDYLVKSLLRVQPVDCLEEVPLEVALQALVDLVNSNKILGLSTCLPRVV